MNKRNHHHVPKFYIKNFHGREDGNNYFVAVYNNETKIYEEKNIRDVLVKNDFYKIPEEWTKDGNCDVLEDCLAEIEGVAARIFKKIILNKSISSLEQKDWQDLFFHMFIQLLRISKMLLAAEE